MARSYARSPLLEARPSLVSLTLLLCATWAILGRSCWRATGRSVSLLSVHAVSVHGPSFLDTLRAQFPDSAFKISMLDQWFVVVSGRDMVEDIRKRPEEELEVPRGAQEVRGYAWAITMLLGSPRAQCLP